MNKNDYKRAKGKSAKKHFTKEKSDKPRIESVRESANDPSWYTVSGQLTKDVATLSFNNPLGAPFSLNCSAITSSPFRTATKSFPGIMTIYMAPFAGFSTDGSSALNIAAKNIYSFVRHENSGHSNYDSPDLMLYLIAMANLYGFYSWMTRIYGQSVVYTQQNRYYGNMMLTSQGVDPSSIRVNLANFRAYINQFALKLGALCVPNTMPIYKRYSWMFANAFKDENTAKAQVYMYQPAYFYKYVETNGPGYLKPEPWGCTTGTGGNALGTTLNLTFQNIVNYGDALLAAVINSEDLNIMSGDILKAYGRENIWQLDMIDENYAIVPIFSEEILGQIHNTRFMGGYPVAGNGTDCNFDKFEIAQNALVGDGALICAPMFRNYLSASFDGIMDFWNDDPNPDQVITGSRNYTMGVLRNDGTSDTPSYSVEPRAAGSDIPLFAVIWSQTFNSSTGTMTIVPRTMFLNDVVSNNATLLDAEEDLGHFNEHPLIYTMSSGNNLQRIMGEISNYTPVAFETAKKMHDSALLSLLAVPLIGNIVK